MPIRTQAQAAAAYAHEAHKAFHENGRRYRSQKFATVAEFVDRELAGDADREVTRLADEFGSTNAQARSLLRVALAEVKIGYLNDSWKIGFANVLIAQLAESAADAYVEERYTDDDFDPEGAVAWANAEGQFASALGAALRENGFEDDIDDGDKADYEQRLSDHVEYLVTERDQDVVADWLHEILPIVFEAVVSEPDDATSRAVRRIIENSRATDELGQVAQEIVQDLLRA